MKNGVRHFCRAALVLVLAMISIPIVAGTANAADGTGTMTASRSYLVSGSASNDLDFTYTAGAGGVSNGTVTILVPSAFPTPVTDGFQGTGVSNLCGGTLTIGAVGSGNLITITGITLPVGSVCDVKYGNVGFNGGWTAPVATNTYTFTTQEKSTSGGTLTTLASGSPQVVVGDSGTGTMAVSPTHAVNATGGNTFTFTYTATRTSSNGKLEVDIPANWSTPSTTANAPGYTTSTCGTVGVAGNAVTISGLNIVSAGTCTITYGNTGSGGPGVTTPTNGGSNTFNVAHASNSSTTPVDIVTFPKVSVTAADGAGTMTASPTSIISSSTGNDITFTYSPGPGGIDNGTVSILVPTGLPTPSTDGFSGSGFISQCSSGVDPTTITSVAGGSLVTFPDISVAANGTCVFKYGNKGFNGGWTAPSGSSTNVFTTKAKSFAGGTMTALGTSPVVTVTVDGTGTMTVAPPHAVVSSSGNTETFTYTAAVAMSSGVITVDVPSGWTPPSTTLTDPGYTTSTCGTVSVAGQKITVSGVTKAAAATCNVVYGSKVSGGPGATTPSTGGSNTFTTQQKSSAGGTLLTLSTGSPSVSVTAPDGAGTMTVSPTSIVSGSTGNDLTFTYSPGPGGTDNGSVSILVPTAFPAPVTDGFQGTGFISQCASGVDPTTITSVAGGSLVTFPDISVPANGTCVFKYGNKGFNGGWTAPAGTSTYAFTSSAKSSAGGAITALASSPSVSLVQDGSGTMTVSPPTTSASSVHNTFAFTYTAGFPMSAGEVTIDIPAGWSAPSTTGTAAGFSTTDCAGATVSAAGNTIHASNLTLAGGASCTITYGDTASGGPGATASSSTGTVTFNAKEKSTAGGTLTAIGTSPGVTTYAADGTGTFTVAPSTVATGATAQTLTFTYTAATGGMSGGRIELTVPTGWSVPSTTATAAGRTTSTCASVTIATRTIQLTNVGLAAGATCTITYGDKTGGGTGATAPTAQGASTFAATQKSSGPGALAAVAASPSVTVGSVAPPTPNHTLTVTVTGSGTVTGPGIACPGTCAKTAAQGTTVALTATPVAGWALTSWGNAGCPGLGVCNIALNTDQTVAAVFQQLAVCTVKPTGPKVKVPAAGKKGKPTLTVIVTCSQAVKATLSGKATETFTVKTTVKGKTRIVKKTVVVAFASTTKNLKAKTKTTYIVNVPPAVMNALKLNRATSVTFTLKTKNAIGATIVTVKIKRLRR